MNSDANLQLQFRFVFDRETLYRIQYSQSHQSDFPGVIESVSLWQSRHHHICVTNGFDLDNMHLFKVESGVK